MGNIFKRKKTKENLSENEEVITVSKLCSALLSRLSLSRRNTGAEEKTKVGNLAVRR